MVHSKIILFSVKKKKAGRAYLKAQLVKNLPAIQETSVWFLGQEDLFCLSLAPLWFKTIFCKNWLNMGLLWEW